MKKRYRKTEKALDILDKTAVTATFKLLDFLALLGEVVFRDPYENIHLAKYEREFRAKRFNKHAYHNTVTRCVNRGWIKKTKKDGKLFLKLTAQGNLQLLRQRLKNGLPNRKSHDGNFWLVLFDIPEMASRERDTLRRFLRDIKFHQLQKSVYISPYPIPKEAFAFLEQSNLRRFIRCMKVTDIDNPKDLQHLIV